MRRKFVVFTISVLCAAMMMLASCHRSGGDVELVKTGHLRLNQTKTVGQALDGYKYFTAKDWKAYTENGNHFVRFTGTLDISDRLTKEYYAEMEKKGIPGMIVTRVDLILIFSVDQPNKSFNTVSVEYVFYRKQGTKGYDREEVEQVLNPIYNNERLRLP